MNRSEDDADLALLLRDIAANNASSIAARKRLYTHFRPRLLAFFRRHQLSIPDAEDLLQDVFLKVVSRAHQCQGSASPSIHQTARNHMHDGLRNQAARGEAAGRYVPIDAADSDELTSTAPPRPPSGPRPDRLHAQHRPGQPRRPKRAEVSHLSAYEDWSVQHVASFLEHSVDATREYLSQCHKKVAYSAPTIDPRTFRGGWRISPQRRCGLV